MTTAPPPQGDYVPAARFGALITTAGMTPRVNGVAQFVGVIGDDLSEDDGRRAVRIAVQNAADAVMSFLETGESVLRCVRLTVYLVCAAGFTAHSAIADEASAYLRQRWGSAALGPTHCDWSGHPPRWSASRGGDHRGRRGITPAAQESEATPVGVRPHMSDRVRLLGVVIMARILLR